MGMTAKGGHPLAQEVFHSSTQSTRNGGAASVSRRQFEEIISSVARRIKDTNRPSVSTVIIWVRMYLASGLNVGALKVANLPRKENQCKSR
jgi:hypothetical protein